MACAARMQNCGAMAKKRRPTNILEMLSQIKKTSEKKWTGITLAYSGRDCMDRAYKLGSAPPGQLGERFSTRVGNGPKHDPQGRPVRMFAAKAFHCDESGHTHNEVSAGQLHREVSRLCKRHSVIHVSPQHAYLQHAVPSQ